MRNAFGNTRMKFVAGAVLLLLAGAASAQSYTATLVGGGATLPAFGYAGDTSTRLEFPVSGSFLSAAFSGTSTTTSYCQTGSGGGKNVLAGGTFGNVANACNTTITPVGFGGTGLSQPHFVGSDSPITATDYNNYLSNHSAGAVLQAPAVSGAIAIAYNQSQIASVNLTETQLCQVFSGQIKTWNALVAAGGATVKSGQTLPANTNIGVAFRSDGSGTSFSFANHLTAKCSAASTVDPTGSKGFLSNGSAPNFVTDQAWTVAAAAYISSYAAQIPASGNPGVITAIQGNPNSIGYVEAANSSSAGLSVARIRNDRDSAQTTNMSTWSTPVTYGGTLLPVSTVNDQVIDGVVSSTNGRPNVVTLASKGITPGISNCLKLVNPDNYAVPAKGYPILAVSNMEFNAKGNGAQLANVRTLASALYNSTVQSNTFSVGASTGLSFLTVTPAITSSEVSRCVVN